MKNLHLKIAEEVLKVAEDLVFADDYEYIYDPDHKKKPGGGYIQTESGWSKGKKEEKSDGTSKPKGTINQRLRLTDWQKKFQKENQEDFHKFVEKYQNYGTFGVHNTEEYETISKMEMAINENNNYDACRAIAEYYGDQKSIELLNKFEKEHTEVGHLTPELAEKRSKITKPLYDKIDNDPNFQEAKQVYKMENFYTPKQLDVLSDLPWMRKIVATNPNTHPKTLDKLANNEDKNVREIVAKNPNTSQQTLDKLSNDKDDVVKVYGKKNYVREAVASNPNTSPETLEKLAEDKVWDVRAAVASNKNISQDAIKKLIKTVSYNNNGHTAINLSGNPNLSSENIDELYSKSYFPDTGREVNRNLAKHPNTSTEILNKLSNSDDEETSKTAKENLAKRKPKEVKFDITKLSPELREKVKDWDAEDIAKFIGWLKKQKEGEV